MATVLRIKRRCEDEPLDHLLISCKRKRVDDTDEACDEQNLHRAIVKFAGTLDNQKINIAKHLKNQTKHDLETNYKKPTKNTIIEKSRIKVKELSKQNRWKVVNCSRAVDDTADDDNVTISDNRMTIIDVEDCSTELPHDKVEKYVYDIYYTEDNNDELSFDTGISIHEMEEGWLVNDDYREGEGYNCDNPDDSDSNSESNWRNDYGEEDEDGEEEDDYCYDNDDLVDEDDIVQAFNRCGVNDEFNVLTEEELSDDEDYYYNDKLDQADIDMGGILYAKYKAKLKYGKFKYDDDDDDDDDYDDDDDDDDDDKTRSDTEMIICNDSTVRDN